jgi:hypothetical protein
VKSRFPGTQDAIQFFDKLQELLSTFFPRNQRAEFANAITVRLIHVHDEAAVSQHGASSVCSTSHSAGGRFSYLSRKGRNVTFVGARVQVTD